jgi:hypothetical protein
VGKLKTTLAALLLASALAGCGDSGSEPTPPSSGSQASWYFYAVQCSNCPGLTNVEIDRTTTPHLARLRVGQLTSLRAAVRDGCGSPAPALQIVRWLASSPEVVRVEPSSSESAIVTALAPGSSRVTAERQLASGVLSQMSLRDAVATGGCSPLPELVFEIIP